MDPDPIYLVSPALVGFEIPQTILSIVPYGARALALGLRRHADAPPAQRLAIMIALGIATNQGTPEELAHRHELAALAPAIIEGDRNAIEEAVAWTLAHSPRVIAEPPAEARRLALAHDCEALLSRLSAAGLTPERREMLSEALAIRSGQDRAEYADEDAVEELIPHLVALRSSPDRAALAAARQWVAQYIRSPAPWESAR